MKTSEVIQSIKEALNLNRAQIMHIYELEEVLITKDRVDSILKNSSKKGSINATYEELGVFLDGLVQYKRGTSKQTQEEDVILDNNLILKKLRAALNLKEHELIMIFELADYKISKSTIKDMFRSPNNPKLKECTNATLKAFLTGLNEFYFDSGEYL
jgi:uncharacterized protein YehS (DUF1456 family)